MNSAIELHDSECMAVQTDIQGRGFVLLDAYVHRSDGEPGVARGEGGVQRIRLKVDAMTVNGDVGNLPADIYEGSLTVGKSSQNNIVPFPASYSEPVLLRLMIGDDARIITISGVALSIESEGDFKFVEQVDFSGL